MSDSYILKRHIVRRTQTTSGEIREEVLRAAGTEITLREAEAADLMILDKFDGAQVAGTIAMITALSDLDGEKASKLKAVDFAALGELLADVMDVGPLTGETL